MDDLLGVEVQEFRGLMLRALDLGFRGLQGLRFRDSGGSGLGVRDLVWRLRGWVRVVNTMVT